MSKTISFLILIFFINLSSLEVLANPIDNIKYKNIDGTYNFFVEIPAGTKEKWEINKKTGILELELKGNKKRTVNFLSYPGNYGFIPQTLAGDKDPLDVIDIDTSVKRGSTVKVNIIGALYFVDKKKIDIKLIAVKSNGMFENITNLNQLLYKKPSIPNVLKIWFESYKKAGKMVFFRYISKNESHKIIDDAHLAWKKANKQ